MLWGNVLTDLPGKDQPILRLYRPLELHPTATSLPPFLEIGRWYKISLLYLKPGNIDCLTGKHTPAEHQRMGNLWGKRRLTQSCRGNHVLECG